MKNRIEVLELGSVDVLVMGDTGSASEAQGGQLSSIKE